jgi:pimeloyl-ACP methyl ester carboxylesterase
MKHQLVDVPGGRIHLVEQGEGPLVLLVHGFPESWYSWRHQLPALAEAGFRAVAIDVRGYGRSSAPCEVEAYRMLAHVSDNAGVVRALGEQAAVVVGHDWGSAIAANCALLRPDIFRAVALMSVPYTPRGGPRPTSIFARIGGDEEFYVSYFQQVGRAEAEIEPDVRGWLRGFYAALAGTGDAHVFMVPPGRRLADRFPSGSWLSSEDLDVYAGEFERTGFFGALGRYRNVDRDWEDLAAWDGAAIAQPSLFLTGEHDATRGWLGPAIDRLGETMPGLLGSHVIEGAGHWVQQERPDEVSALLVEWLGRVVAR